MNEDDILIEIEDRIEAETILTALNKEAAAEYRAASEAMKQANAALSAWHFDAGRRIDRLITRFYGALYPDEPPDEYEPPLPKDDPDYNGAELLQIRAQSRVPA